MTIYITDSHDLIGINGVPERPKPEWNENGGHNYNGDHYAYQKAIQHYNNTIADLIKSGTPFEEPEKIKKLLPVNAWMEGKTIPGFYTVDLGKTEKIWQYKNHEHYWWECSPVYANTVPHYQYRQVIRILESKEEPMNKNYTPEELLEYHELNELIKTYEGGQSPPAHKLRRLIFLESKIKSKPLNESIQPHHLTDAKTENKYSELKKSYIQSQLELKELQGQLNAYARRILLLQKNLTDAEIESEAKRCYSYSIYQEIAFVEGAKWYRDKTIKK